MKSDKPMQLDKIKQLLATEPYTLATVRQFVVLEQQASKDEQAEIAELQAALIAGLDMQTQMQAYDEGLL